MDKKLKTKWIKALLSGNYRQGSDALHANRSYCCLGVLAAIQGCRWQQRIPFFAGKPIGNESLLDAQAAGGLRKPSQNKLANMNDGRGQTKKSFAEIAEYLKSHY